jgi:hypothetical protein
MLNRRGVFKSRAAAVDLAAIVGGADTRSTDSLDVDIDPDNLIQQRNMNRFSVRFKRLHAEISVCSLIVAAGITAILALGLAGCVESTSDVQHGEAATPARVRVMTAQQYANMIADVFGADVKPGTPLPPLRRNVDGLLATSAASIGLTAGQLLQVQRAAATVAMQVVDNGNPELQVPAHREYLVPCKPVDASAADDVCARKFIRSVGRLLFRRPLGAEQIEDLVGKAHSASEVQKNFYAGLSGVLEGMLLDPQVILIVDTTESDPSHPGSRRLDGFALASRLSFFLWNSVPDDTLLKAAESGELNTPRGRARMVDNMLASPRLQNGIRAFFDDMFGFDDFDTLSKDPSVYPNVSGAALKDAREQTLRTVVELLLKQNGDYRDLFTSRTTFMSQALAVIYGVPASPGWTRYEFPAGSPRVGLLTQVSFLALHAHPARSSPTLRGKALREILFCQKVPPPPPNVDFSIIEDPSANFRTARERLAAHRSNPVCAGCHKITDPTGLALENFDGGGRFRTAERGVAIDVSGSFDGRDFTDVQGLGQIVHDQPALPACLVRRIYSYGTGGTVTAASEPELVRLTQGFAAAGYRVPELLRSIALSDGFSRIAESTASPAG